jgi:hypothetical protein
MHSRAQAAMEFLMTYGWALLVVLIVISALAYFGVLSPGNLVSERCSFEAGLGCSDFQAGSNGVSVQVQNNLGRTITVQSVSFNSDALSGPCAAYDVNAVIAHGGTAKVYASDSASCQVVDTGRQKNSYDVALKYIFSESSLPHKAAGTLVVGALSVPVDESGYGGGGLSENLAGSWGFAAAGPVVDESGQVAAGTANGATWQNANCASGGCYTFDGSNDYLSIPDSDMWPRSTIPFTIAAWIYKNPNSNHDYIVGQHASNNAYWGFGSEGTGLRFLAKNGAPYIVDTTAAGAAPDGQWLHVAAVRDGNNFFIYVNGVSQTLTVSTVSGSFPNPSASLYVGRFDREPVAANRYFDGIIDDLRIYNRSLSQQEIAALAGQ